MEGVPISILLEQLATLALDKIDRELKLVTGVKQEIEILTSKLEAIQAVLEDAEQRQQTEASVKLWLDKLNEVSHDMDSVLDEWITRVLIHQQEKQEFVTTTKKVCFPSCFRFGQVDYQLFLRRKIAKKIKELNEKLDLIDLNKQSFTLTNIPRVGQELSHRETTSLLSVKMSLFGRDREKNVIISKLLSESSNENEVPLIIPIVGMGGMGKTTLAQLVYNDEHVKSHFDKRVWVCVSDPFEEKKIARAIIESLDKNNTSKNSNESETLMQCIYGLLEGKKFLLVLDDVWNPTSRQWEELIKCLQNGASGSRVLVTTRKKEVAIVMKAESQMITVDSLDEEFCLSLFYYNAGRDESTESKEFRDIGLELVKRCKGLPLAAKTLGSLMYNKKNIHEWQAVLNSKTWELKEMQQDVFKPLLLSYNDLTPATKQCLLYCALFPKDYVYDKNALIQLWMSQDYLNVKNHENKMMVGENYFHDLVMRSFFQDVMVRDLRDSDLFLEHPGKVTCKIHDITHDFLQSLTKDKINQVECDGSERNEMAKDKVHHLNLKGASDSALDCLVGYERLRTLIVKLDKQSDSGHSRYDLIVQSKNLRTLTIDGGTTDEIESIPSIVEIKSIPKNIGELIHLRYLDLSGSLIEELPRDMRKLYNLQTLRLVGCRSLRKIDVRRLINLRHLCVDRGPFCPIEIKGIERLKDLQTLDTFIVGDGENNTNKLEHLKDLNQLQGSLRLWFDKTCTIPQNNAKILVSKTHLQHLAFSFGYTDSKIDLLVLNVLEPHPALESLFIRGYGGRAFSDWFSSLHSLRHLDLIFCDYCEMLPPLGKLASLESLTLWMVGSLLKIGVEFLGIEKGQTSPSFPKLKHLMFVCVYSWTEWEAGVEEEEENRIAIMPCLSELAIYGCEELKTLPDFLWKTPLQKLSIRGNPTLQDTYRRGTGEQGAKISHIPTILLED